MGIGGNGEMDQAVILSEAEDLKVALRSFAVVKTALPTGH
jgi:hypothetical protein